MNIFRIISLLLILSVVSCKTKYATKEFIYSEAPKSPDYSELNSWAAHPEKNDPIIDAFYPIKSIFFCNQTELFIRGT